MAFKNPTPIINSLVKKVWNHNDERLDFIKNDPYFKDYELKEVDIDKLIQDNDLDNPVALSNHAALWTESGNEEDVNPGAFKYDPTKDTKKNEVIYATELPNGKIRLNDGRHRTRALKNAGYTHLNIPIIKGAK